VTDRHNAAISDWHDS